MHSHTPKRGPLVASQAIGCFDVENCVQVRCPHDIQKASTDDKTKNNRKGGLNPISAYVPQFDQFVNNSRKAASI